MADDQSETECELRRLYRDFAGEPLPEPLLSDEDLVAELHARLRAESSSAAPPSDQPCTTTGP